MMMQSQSQSQSCMGLGTGKSKTKSRRIKMVERKCLSEDSFVPVLVKKRRLSEKIAVLLLDLESPSCKDVVEKKLVSTAYHIVYSLRTAREALAQFKPDMLLVSKPPTLSVELTFTNIPTVLLVNDTLGDGFQLELPKGCNDYILLSELSDPVLRWTESRARRVVKPSPPSPEHLAKMVDILSAQDGRGYWVCEKGAEQPVHVSASCSHLLQRSSEETKRLLSCPLQHNGFVHPKDLSRYITNIQEGLKVGGKSSFQCRILLPQDQVQSVHFRLESHYDSSSKVVHYGSVRPVDHLELNNMILKDRSNIEEKCTCHESCSCEPESSTAFPGQHQHGKRSTGQQMDAQKLADKVKNLEHALSLALKETNAKARLVEFVSHEVRTLLNGIVGAVELLDVSKLSELETKYIDTINTSCTSMLRVLNDVLTYAKMEAGMVQIKPSPFDLPKFMEQVSIAYKDRDSAVVFKASVGKEVPNVIKADAVRLRQILSNLLNNGYNFTTSGFVSVGIEVLSHEGSAVKLRFSVEDTGVGIPEEAINTLFDPFTQAQDRQVLEGSRSALGTGLGLSISQTLVDLMGGRLEVQSSPSKGSVFSFVLPVECCDICPSELEQPRKEKRGGNAVPGEFASLRVLVADDDPLGQTLLLRMLLKLGCQVEAVSNGEEAVRKIQEDGIVYDLVLMDCDMPVVNGYTATSRIRKWEATRISGSTKRKALIYACTAHVLQSNVARCLDAGMDSYLTKPLRLDDLRSACKKAVSLKGLN